MMHKSILKTPIIPFLSSIYCSSLARSLALLRVPFSYSLIPMATISMSSVSIAGGSHLKSSKARSGKCNSLGITPRLTIQRKSKQTYRKLSVRAEYNDRSGGGDFVAGFVLGGALFGALGYIFAPQIRRSLLNEDEYGFRRAKQPIYYDEGLEKTRQTLNAKISQLNSAIDNVSSRLRGGNKKPPVPIESDPEEATM